MDAYYDDGWGKIYHGDCRDILPQLPDNSIDAVVTDPPYGLGFMGKEWDTFDRSQFGQKGLEGPKDLKVKKNFNILPRYRTDGLYDFALQWATLALQAIKPGGHLLCFGGTRTHHRLMCAIEDAGWEIRDVVMWTYGQGFPKSLDVSKAIDKMKGLKREVVGRKVEVGGYKGFPHSDDNWVHDKERALEISIPATPEAQQWEGWGTGLKPAWEPIILARKPLEGTVAENVLKYGTGAINIDGCRVGTEEMTSGGSIPDIRANNYENSYGKKRLVTPIEMKQGRFPANLIHDGSEEVMEMFPIVSSGKPAGIKAGGKLNCYGVFKGGIPVTGIGDSGTAARFFYTAKASRAERERGLKGFIPCVKCGGIDTDYHLDEEGKQVKCTRNPHPTVKPLALMRYLIKLITPPGGIILDPFMGSGSTLVATRQLGFRAIGIEIDKADCEITVKRCCQTVMDLI